MGNCLRRESSRNRCADEDWEYAEKGSVNVLGKRTTKKEEAGPLLGTDDGTGFISKGIHSTSSLTEVKIKITKKQLQQLLGKMDENELSAHEALAQLIKVSDQHLSHERPWRPVLQSIPEVN